MGGTNQTSQVREWGGRKLKKWAIIKSGHEGGGQEKRKFFGKSAAQVGLGTLSPCHSMMKKVGETKKDWESVKLGQKGPDEEEDY